MDKSIIDKLYLPLDVREREGAAGKKFKYVASEDIIDRMNRTFEGNWSVQILSKEIIQDQVLVSVRVMVQDPTNTQGARFEQESFASHPLAKYADGPKAGQIIDAGNSFRAATSKAIKAAVARWGLGLYLESEEDAEPVNRPTFANKNGYSAPKPTTPPPVSAPTVKAAPVVVPPVQKAAVPPTPVAPPPQPKVESTNPQPEPVAASTASTKLEQTQGDELLTPVQRVAIETIVSVHKLNYNDLLVKALQRSENLPLDITKMSYSDAVKVIQYGNNLKNR